VTAADFLAEQSHPTKAAEARICVALLAHWPNFLERPAWQRNDIMQDVRAVQEGRNTPCLSRVQREAVEKAWKEIA
jgi:hypothetical protein